MPRIYLKIEGSRPTTRDGSHPDDQRYVEQIVESLREELARYDFVGVEIRVEIAQ